MNGPASRPPWSVELHGPGRVGRALLDLLPPHGIAVAAVCGRADDRPETDPTTRRIFVDATSPRYDGAEAERWVTRLATVLTEGTPVVTCNKAPLAIGWDRLSLAARRGRTTLSCSATVGGGTPILLATRRLHRSQGVVRVDASLSGTLSYLCDRVTEGATLSQAKDEAIASGVAEPDPSLDLDGTDSVAKAVILHNLLYAPRWVETLRDSRPRLHLDEEGIRTTARAGPPVRAVATITPGQVGIALGSFPEAAPLRSIRAPAVVRVTLRSGLSSTLGGPGAGAEATAGALLGDLLELTDPLGPGIGGAIA
jgi:homoserine dehydrogenase